VAQLPRDSQFGRNARRYAETDGRRSGSSTGDLPEEACSEGCGTHLGSTLGASHVSPTLIAYLSSAKQRSVFDFSSTEGRQVAIFVNAAKTCHVTRPLPRRAFGFDSCRYAMPWKQTALMMSSGSKRDASCGGGQRLTGARRGECSLGQRAVKRSR